jgi:hypothetical protein
LDEQVFLEDCLLGGKAILALFALAPPPNAAAVGVDPRVNHAGIIVGALGAAHGNNMKEITLKCNFKASTVAQEVK